jgi:hypothetical protein
MDLLHSREDHVLAIRRAEHREDVELEDRRAQGASTLILLNEGRNLPRPARSRAMSCILDAALGSRTA